MDKAAVTVKGQVVIPARLRRKFGIKKGTQVYLYERDGEIVIKPITDESIRSMAGFTGTKGKLLKALMKGKAKERESGERRGWTTTGGGETSFASDPHGIEGVMGNHRMRIGQTGPNVLNLQVGIIGKNIIDRFYLRQQA